MCFTSLQRNHTHKVKTCKRTIRGAYYCQNKSLITTCTYIRDRRNFFRAFLTLRPPPRPPPQPLTPSSPSRITTPPPYGPACLPLMLLLERLRPRNVHVKTSFSGHRKYTPPFLHLTPLAISPPFVAPPPSRPLPEVSRYTFLWLRWFSEITRLLEPFNIALPTCGTNHLKLD